MSREEFTKATAGLPNADYLAWRVSRVKKHRSEISHRRAYNERPRLRSEMHH